MRLFLFSIYLLLVSAIAQPQPKINQQADFSILNNRETAYRFQTLYFDSADGKRHYRVYVGIPKTTPPPSGFPVLYALDGNAVLAELTTPRLKALAAGKKPILVLIGYNTELRLNSAARAYDYTPPDENGMEYADAIQPNRRNGGAAAFLTLLRMQIQPSVVKLANINLHEQTLWGHSYGGLFVLYTLLNKPMMFQHYVAADPSLWVRKGLMLKQWQNGQYPILADQTTLVLLKSGRANAPAVNTAAQALYQAVKAVPENSTEQLANKWANTPHLQVHYQVYPNQNHGSLFAYAFEAALNRFTAKH
ncbi:alpha/beta hydrolase [Stenoxybacter acetivorans]|uniref:alpha/beta hydrolase n=1 Tax=Stenoxybacter acetivorans TaxID=422441 RepID=UPI00055D9F36|nr:alpha/beta hydrolase-fold protein [Stenoxybacter acetivorans]